jgi:hypothetical protein
VAANVIPFKRSCSPARVPSILRVCNNAFVRTFFRVGYCASILEFNLIIIYVCIRVRERTCWLMYETSIVSGSVLKDCGIYVFVCQCAWRFACIQALVISPGVSPECMKAS